MTWTFDGTLPTFDAGGSGGYTFDGSGGGGSSSSGAGAITDPSDTVSGSGFTKSLGSGAITDAHDVVSGSGTTAGFGSGAIADPADTVVGSGSKGAADAGAGAGMITDPADAVAGTGITSITGSGAIFDLPDIVLGSGANAPFIISSPVSEAILNSTSATLTASAGGTGPLSVQWFYNNGSGLTICVEGVDGTGVTSTTFVTRALSTSDSGIQYEAVFSNIYGSATTSAATITVTSIIYSGGNLMQFVFGPGNLVATPLTDAYGNTIATPSPRKLGTFQEASFDTSSENKMLYGPNQFPVAVGRGKAKVGLKVKAAQISIDQWNAIYIGQPQNQSTAGAAGSVISAYIDTQGTTIPTTPFQITPVTTYASFLTAGTTPVYDYDLGVQDGAGNSYVRVASSPAAGQYSIASGVYTFNTGDAGKLVFINFVYTATPASSTTTPGSVARNAYVNVSNIPMGQAPFLQLDLYCNYGGNPLLVTLFQAIASKLSFSTKLDDFAVPDIEFDGFANSSNIAYRIAAGQ